MSVTYDGWDGVRAAEFGPEEWRLQRLGPRIPAPEPDAVDDGDTWGVRLVERAQRPRSRFLRVPQSPALTRTQRADIGTFLLCLLLAGLLLRWGLVPVWSHALAHQAEVSRRDER